MNFYVLIIVLLLINNSINKSLSVQLSKINSKIRPNFDEIFGKEWENENMENQNEQNEINANINYTSANQFADEQKREIVHKFHAIKERIKKRGKYSKKVRNQIEQKIAKKLGINQKKIYKWKKEFGITAKNYYEKKKQEFTERIDEFKRMSENGKQKQFAKELGIGKETLRKWQKEFGIEMGKRGNRFSNEEKASKMKIYYKTKNANSSVSDKEIAELLKISRRTLNKWKKRKEFENFKLNRPNNF